MELTIKETPIYYEEYGEGTPVICLHGYTVDSNLMKGCLEPIFTEKDGYKRIYIDFPGMGNSPANPYIKNSDNMLECLIELIEKIIGEEKFLIAGESYGGYISLGFIKNMAERIEGALFICPCVISKRLERKTPKRTVIQADKRFLKENLSPDEEQFMYMSVKATEKTFERYITDIGNSLEKCNKEFIKNFSKYGYSLSCEKDFKDIHFDKPCCFFTGRQDHVVGYKDQWKFLEHFPRTTFALIDGVGHNMQLETPEIFNVITNDWLDRVAYETQQKAKSGLRSLT